MASVELAEISADTSPFCRFAEAGCCGMLIDYLGNRLVLTTTVVAELEYRAKAPKHADLATLAQRKPPWSPATVVSLDDDALHRADVLAQGWRRMQERQTGETRDPRANLGEATAIIVAETRGSTILIDEGRPKRYALSKGITVVTTAELVAEMYVAGRCEGKKRAFHIYQRVYRGTKSEFDAECAAATGRLAA